MVEHILIIGGGIIGVCTAYFLSQDERMKKREISVTVVEANEPASGASGKAAGFLALDWHSSATTSLAELSYALHQELADVFDGENIYGYRKLTSLTCSVRVSEEEVDAPSLNPAFADVNLETSALPLDQDRVQTKWLDGVGVENVRIVAGEDTNAQVHPELFTQTLLAAAQARGVQYIKGRPRVWDKAAEGRPMTIDTPEGVYNVPAEIVVLAAGPWTRQVAKELLGVDLPIYDLPGHSVLIRPVEPFPPLAVRASIYGAKAATGSPALFARPDGLVYVAGQNTGAPLPLQGTADVTVDPDAIRKLLEASAVLSSTLKDGVVEAEQLCYRSMTKDGAPLIGALDGVNGVFVATGHGPWGITLAPGTGKVISELILDGNAKSAEISELHPSRHVDTSHKYL